MAYGLKASSCDPLIPMDLELSLMEEDLVSCANDGIRRFFSYPGLHNLQPISNHA